MRWLCALCLIVMGAAAAHAASVDAARIAAIGQAADAFLAKAAEARKSAMVPRQSDPGIGPLLDTVFDTGDLAHGPIAYADFDRLADWLGRISAVGGIYLAAARASRDVGLFGAEIGRYYDAALAVMQAMIDCQMAELDAHPGAKLAPEDQRKLARLRASVAGAFGGLIDVFRAPRLTVGWVGERLNALTAAAPSMARFLTPDELARLRTTTLQLGAQTRDKKLRLMFDRLAVALAEPPPPTVPSTETPPGSAEIALDGDGKSYWVPARINGTLTVKFVVDSGASVVVLPKDVVSALTRAGAIAASDILGRADYVTADGSKHAGEQLMLRELNVGGHIVRNVLASVAPAKAVPLLGQSFLAKFKSWTLDNRRHVLIIAE